MRHQNEAKSASSLSPKKEKTTSMRNFYIGAGVVAGVALIGAIATSRPSTPKTKKKKLGIKVKPQCAGYTITDLIVLRENLRKSLQTAAKSGAPDPFQITSKFLSQKRLGCTVYPNQVRNPGEAETYAAVFKLVTELMQQEHLASEKQRRAFDEMASTWAKSMGATTTDAPASPEPEDDGGEPQS